MIVRASITPFSLRLRAPLATGRRVFAAREGVLLALRDVEGLEGFGEATPIPGFGCETAEASLGALERLADALLGRRPEDRDVLLDEGRALAPDAPGARGAVDIALCDLSGRRRGVAVADLLAAPAGEAAARRTVQVNALVSAEDPAEVASRGRAALERGFRTLKLKLGSRDLPDDLERVAALRQAVGPATRIRLDANGAWSPAAAREALDHLVRFEIEYVEEPIRVENDADLECLARLREGSTVPIAADECAASEEQAARVVAARAADLLVVKLAAVGGLRAARRIASLAAEAGVGVVVTSGLDSAVGVTAALQLSASLDGALPACGLATGNLLLDDLADPPQPQRGVLALPRGPGLGISPDPNRLARCAVGSPKVLDR